jgi:hypothetical protein
MAESKSSDKGEKSIEMRLSEIEDKLAQLHITDEEMKAYQKVSGLMGQGGTAAFTPDPNVIGPCVLPRHRLVNRGIITPRINRWVCECNECSCGPCIQWGGGGGFGGGGFGGMGF